DRQAEPVCVVTEVLPEDLSGDEERCGPFEPLPRQVRHVLAGVQRETVVEVGPGVSDDGAALQHAMRDAARGELLRRGEACGATADDERLQDRHAENLRRECLRYHCDATDAAGLAIAARVTDVVARTIALSGRSRSPTKV